MLLRLAPAAEQLSRLLYLEGHPMTAESNVLPVITTARLC